jgi:hypothetical protein
LSVDSGGKMSESDEINSRTGGGEKCAGWWTFFTSGLVLSAAILKWVIGVSMKN